MLARVTDEQRAKLAELYRDNVPPKEIAKQIMIPLYAVYYYLRRDDVKKVGKADAPRLRLIKKDEEDFIIAMAKRGLVPASIARLCRLKFKNNRGANGVRIKLLQTDPNLVHRLIPNPISDEMRKAILEHANQGWTSKKIGELLGVSPQTVNYHKRASGLKFQFRRMYRPRYSDEEFRFIKEARDGGMTFRAISELTKTALERHIPPTTIAYWLKSEELKKTQEN